MRNSNGVPDHDLNCAFQITHRHVILRTHGPKYRHSNDNSNCAILMIIQIAHFCSSVKTVWVYKFENLQSSLIDITFTFMVTRWYLLSPFRLSPESRGQSGESLFLLDRPSTLYSQMPPLSEGQSRLSGFGCVLDHSATTFGACAYSIKTAMRYQLRTQGRSPLQIFPPNPSTVEGARGDLSSSVQTIGLEGDTPRCGTSPATRGIVWTGSLSLSISSQGAYTSFLKQQKPNSHLFNSSVHTRFLESGLAPQVSTG